MLSQTLLYSWLNSSDAPGVDRNTHLPQGTKTGVILRVLKQNVHDQKMGMDQKVLPHQGKQSECFKLQLVKILLFFPGLYVYILGFGLVY